VFFSALPIDKHPHAFAKRIRNSNASSPAYDAAACPLITSYFARMGAPVKPLPNNSSAGDAFLGMTHSFADNGVPAFSQNAGRSVRDGS
jgi:hypothetical protein